jgi:uncharacterized protein YbcV (DUF1398 family)
MKYGYQLFKEKMVTILQVKSDILKLSVSFLLNVHFRQDTGKVSTASCSCVAGQGGLCKYLAALLYETL